MATLYITEQGSILRKTGDRIIIEKDEQALLDVPCHKVDAVLIFGAVQVTIQALSELLEHGIELALFTRHGRLKGQLTPIKSKNIVLRMAQFERARDPAFALQTARAMVQAKIGNAMTVLRRFAYNHPERKTALDAEIVRLDAHLVGIDRVPDLGSLNGLEGIAGRAYFAGLAQMILADLPFPGRRRRPAPDPINALLSFGYTLIGNELHSLLDGMGFDPYLGFLHRIDYGRPSLALDLLEEFRHPLVDRLTLTLINKGILKEADFSLDPASGSMYLTPEAMKVYFRHFERWMLEERIDSPEGQKLGFRRMFQFQAQRMADAVRTGAVYQPFRYGEADRDRET
jgi:CRISPR-associated protein Cas1